MGEIRGARILALEGDITKPLPLPAASLDIVYVSTVLHTFSRLGLEGFLREAERLLKPGGRMAIVEIEKIETPFGPPLSSRYSPEELKALVPMMPEKTVTVGAHFYLQTFRKPKA